MSNFGRFCLLVFFVLGLAFPCFAQELEPRRWGHLPKGTNIVGGGYVFSKTDILADPALRLEDVEAEIHTWAASYTRTFELFGKSAQVGFTQAYQKGRWSGLVDGVAASATRSGLSDSIVRFAVNLYGATEWNRSKPRHCPR